MSHPNLNEDLNVIANSDLTITYMDGNLDIIQQLDDEPNDVGGLTAAELKAKFDEAGNTIKTFLNESLIPEILAADATEASRAAAETARANAEAERQTAEEQRASAETVRQSNEETRESNEAARVAAENLRASAETAREQAESSRVSAETGRDNAESSRVGAEMDRANNEQDRVYAESTRISAEIGRANAEIRRASNETARVAAEQARASAETARDTAEQAREAAETARADENTGIVARATEQANIASSAAASAENNAGAASSYASAAASSAGDAARSAYEASVSETRARASETAARNSETAAKASETAAKASETTAKSEADRAKSEADRAAGIVGGDYATKTELSVHTDDANIHVTAEEKAAWNDSDVFIATYGETTSAEIYEAYQAGKEVICFYSNGIAYRLARVISSDEFFFEGSRPTVEYGSSLRPSKVVWDKYLIECVYDEWHVAVASKNGTVPSTHASTHASGGSDPITPSSIGAMVSAESISGYDATKTQILKHISGVLTWVSE